MCAVALESVFVSFLVLVVSTSQNSIMTVVNPLSHVEPGTLTRVSAVVGGEVEMPCDARPPQRNDSLLLVVWYRDDNPVYSYDTRVPDSQAHWTDDPLSGRARWLGFPTSALQVKNILAKDRATYRCRVDFQVSPTRNYRIALDVIELPNKPVIFDQYGKEISGVAGPYDEGGSFNLTCSVSGGNPTPQIQWLQGDTVLATLGAGEIQKEPRTLSLIIRNASREYLSYLYTCLADNTLHATPQRASVQIDLYLRPLNVMILSREQPLIVGQMAELACRATGARPPAVITWWLGGRLLNSVVKKKDSRDENETLSILQWTPKKEHNGLMLTCRAEHPKLNRSAIENKLPLNIHYVPVSTIQLGAKMNPNDIEEGDDVYFSCEVDANPPLYKVVWEHNGNLIQKNSAKGTIMTGYTHLALRNVSRLQAGQYTCTASNVEGDGKSKELHLQIVYKPLCKKREVRMIGAALQEPSSVVCEVEAFPLPNTFEWTLNSSAGSIKIEPERFTVDSKTGKSVLSFTPVSDADYGTLSCRATNLAGQQSLPCVYTLLPATRPDPPTNCTIYNLTHDSLDLLCVPGYEGGLKCVYIAEVWSHEGLITNSSNTMALWNLRRLGAAKQLRLVIYTANARGRSDHVVITVETAPRLSPRTVLLSTERQSSWEVNWAIGGFLGAAATISLVLCLAFIMTKLRRRSHDYEVTIPTSKIQKATLAKRSTPQTIDDRNPDLIPLSKGIPDCPPEPPPYAAVTAPAVATHHNNQHQQRAHDSISPCTPLSPSSQYPDSQSESGARSLSGANGTLRSHREVVTTRTPLLASHQESCV